MVAVTLLSSIVDFTVKTLFAGAAAAAAIPSVSYGAIKPWNIKGDVLVLDVSSLFYQGNHPMFPSIGNAATCAGYCNKTVGCNAWTFCNSTDGCGSGCVEFVKTNPKRKWRCCWRVAATAVAAAAAHKAVLLKASGAAVAQLILEEP
jgi:hypothetical protein